MKNIITILTIFALSFGYANTIKHNDVAINDNFITSIVDNEKVIITPNPATENTIVKVVDRNHKITQISIYSLLGNQVFTKNYAGIENNITLNVQSFKKGKYLVKIIFKDGSSEVKALIKQ